MIHLSLADKVDWGQLTQMKVRRAGCGRQAAMRARSRPVARTETEAYLDLAIAIPVVAHKVDACLVSPIFVVRQVLAMLVVQVVVRVV